MGLSPPLVWKMSTSSWLFLSYGLPIKPRLIDSAAQSYRIAHYIIGHWCVLSAFTDFASSRIFHFLSHNTFLCSKLEVGDLLEVFTSFWLIDGNFHDQKSKHHLPAGRFHTRNINNIFCERWYIFFARRQIYSRMDQRKAKREESGQSRDWLNSM